MRVYCTVKTSTHYLTRLIVNIKKINKALVCVVFFLWCFVIQLAKRATKSRSYSFPPVNLLKLFFFTSMRHTKQRQTFDLQVYIIMQWKTFHVVHCALIKHHFQYADAYLTFIMPPLLCLWVINRLHAVGTLPCKTQTLLQMLIVNGLIILGHCNTNHNAEFLYCDSCEGMQACRKYSLLFY